MSLLNRFLAPIAAVLVVAAGVTLPSAFSIAGEYFEKGGVALHGYDPISYFTDAKPVRGNPDHRAEHKGSQFLFASKRNLETFKADPERYAPQYGGYCAFGMASGYKAATDPNAFSIVDGKLYLNCNRDVQKQWTADIPGFIVKADAAWPTASKLSKVHE